MDARESVMKKAPTTVQKQAFMKALKPYLAEHRRATVDMYRRSRFALRIRIIDPDFAGLDRVDRDELIREYIKSVPDEVMDELSMLLLLTPDEVEQSIANFDFENPEPMPV
jgi:stress-induced morphogen